MLCCVYNSVEIVVKIEDRKKKAHWHTTQPMHVFWVHQEEPCQMAASTIHPFHLPKESCKSTIVQLEYVQGRIESEKFQGRQETRNKNREQKLLPPSMLT